MPTHDPKSFVSDLLQHLGFSSYNVEVDEEYRRGSIFIYEHEEYVKRNAPALIEAINHIFQLVAKKHEAPHIFFDVNNYRKERERLITELARGAARKVAATKESIELPSMNSYERRIVHVELAAHPDVKTESSGLGKERKVMIKPVE
jgi:spoIIIJ-associated protein